MIYIYTTGFIQIDVPVPSCSMRPALPTTWPPPAGPGPTRPTPPSRCGASPGRRGRDQGLVKMSPGVTRKLGDLTTINGDFMVV